MFPFSKIDKNVENLFDLNYPFTQQISVKTQTKNGIVWETESEVSPQGALARMAASYTKHPQFSLDRIELQTDGKLSINGGI
jgi:hypothetical protein